MGLVDDLADLEVIEAENFVPLPDPIDLADAARRAAGILSMRAREKNITISAPAHEVTLPAVAEFRRVLQILLNLIGNAIRYSPEGSTVIVDLSRDEGFARVAIADQGPGLSSEEQARIFDKFERLGRSGDGGSGLGSTSRADWRGRWEGTVRGQREGRGGLFPAGSAGGEVGLWNKDVQGPSSSHRSLHFPSNPKTKAREVSPRAFIFGKTAEISAC
jgi:K+-sensing histidine kinase KdpD